MAENTKIQWTDATWNPWHGCKKVSPGCKYCYMYRDKERFKQDPTKVMRSKNNFEAPLKMSKPAKIFTCSWSDFFIDEADEWRDEAWDIISKTPQHTYQILTKRPERIFEHLPKNWEHGYKNVWLGISAENQDIFYDRMEIFNELPAVVKFVSFEPLLESIDIGLFGKSINWAIIGGESGNDTGKYRYRPCELMWIISLKNQLKLNNVPVFIKQLGTYLHNQIKLSDRHGGIIDEWPKPLQIREFPNA